MVTCAAVPQGSREREFEQIAPSNSNGARQTATYSTTKPYLARCARVLNVSEPFVGSTTADTTISVPQPRYPHGIVAMYAEQQLTNTSSQGVACSLL